MYPSMTFGIKEGEEEGEEEEEEEEYDGAVDL
jgi:hypothetical protein